MGLFDESWAETCRDLRETFGRTVHFYATPEDLEAEAEELTGVFRSQEQTTDDSDRGTSKLRMATLSLAPGDYPAFSTGHEFEVDGVRYEVRSELHRNAGSVLLTLLEVVPQERLANPADVKRRAR